MQVISRCEHEAIVIDNQVIVTVLEINDDFVRVGIEAPGEVPGYREELLYLEPQTALASAIES